MNTAKLLIRTVRFEIRTFRSRIARKLPLGEPVESASRCHADLPHLTKNRLRLSVLVTSREGDLWAQY
jgi:hypothetical protein